MATYQELQLAAFVKLETEFGAGISPAQVLPTMPDEPEKLGYCLSSLIYLPKELSLKLDRELIEPIRQADPNHCYFMPESLHVTIQNIRTIASPAGFTEDTVETAKKVFSKVVPNHQAFEFVLKRIFEPPTSLSISALSDQSLSALTNELRAELKDAGIPDNKRYGTGEIVFGNVTFCRFKGVPNRALREVVKAQKNNEFGSFIVDRVNLVVTDAVCSPKSTRLVETYYLNSKTV